jgi:acyl carrier protein
MKINISDIKIILQEVFINSDIPENVQDLKLGDFEEWDSLGNFNFLLAVENFFDIRFELDEIGEIKSVQDVISHLNNSK